MIREWCVGAVLKTMQETMILQDSEQLIIRSKPADGFIAHGHATQTITDKPVDSTFKEGVEVTFQKDESESGDYDGMFMRLAMEGPERVRRMNLMAIKMVDKFTQASGNIVSRKPDGNWEDEILSVLEGLPPSFDSGEASYDQAIVVRMTGDNLQTIRVLDMIERLQKHGSLYAKNRYREIVERHKHEWIGGPARI